MSQKVNWVQRKDFGGNREMRCVKQCVEKSPGADGHVGMRRLFKGSEINRDETQWKKYQRSHGG